MKKRVWVDTISKDIIMPYYNMHILQQETLCCNITLRYLSTIVCLKFKLMFMLVLSQSILFLYYLNFRDVKSIKPYNRLLGQVSDRLLGRQFILFGLEKVQLGSMTLLFSSFLFIISKFYISTIIVKIQLYIYKFIIYNTVQIIYIPGYVMSHS